MPRKPSEVYIPRDSLDSAVRATQDHLRRLYEEVADHRTFIFYLGAINHSQRVRIGGAPSLTPTRNRRWLEISAVGNVVFDTGGGGGSSARSSIDVVLYNNGLAGTDVCFDLTVGGTAGTGWKSGTQRTPVNPGKDIMTTTDTWVIIVDGNGGGGNAMEDITLSVTYEDYVPYFGSRRTT